MRPLSLLALPAAAVALEQAQIFLSPRPEALRAPVKTSAHDANALLSSHLGIAEFEHAPKKGFWDALGLPMKQTNAPWETGTRNTLIIMIEGAGDARDYLPPSLTAHGPAILIPSPPSPASFDALVTVYLRRIARVFNLHLGQIRGIENFAQSAASVIGEWAEWAVEGLHETWAEFEDLVRVRHEYKAAVEPTSEYARLLNELDFVDQSGKTLVGELHELDGYVESLSQTVHAFDADGSGRSAPSVAALRFTGLSDVEQAHGKASRAYSQASRVFRDVLEAALGAYRSRTNRETSKVVVMMVPPRKQRRSARKRSAADLLAPFSTRPRLEARQSQRSTPLVPVTQHCYADQASCTNSTGGCSGHGSCVQAARLGGGSSGDACYVCRCDTTTSDGRSQTWAGEACQKQDYSSQFFLLAGSTVALVVTFAASISLLWGIGGDELPPTLAAISGMGPKRE